MHLQRIGWRDKSKKRMVVDTPVDLLAD